MIIVLLLFFTSLCVYCQRLVLYVHDRWINPKNSRLLKEADETSSAATRKLLLEQYHTGSCVANKKQNRKRNSKINACEEEERSGVGGILAEACRFCANSPQGYCRHHFHLQELELQKVQKQQQGHLQTQNWPRFWQTRFWETFCCGSQTSDWEYTTKAQRRQQRKESRELRRNLKNRLNATTSQYQKQEPHHPLHPMQKQFQLQRQFLRRQQYEEYEELMRARNAANNSQSSNSSSSNSSSPLWDTSTSNSSSGYQSPFASVYNVNGSLSELETIDSGLTTSLESVAAQGAEEQESVEEEPQPQVLIEAVTTTTESTMNTSYL
ncbi:uncharacterized protein [Eurosta solidaginis]|uniref:uncharacterized protein n=1 Tax=Eurosta solidaginis TaxID=178769 RepID=UPI003531743A